MAYSLVYPPTIDFEWLVQRPQQLMQAFASLGVKVFYMNLATHTSSKGGVTQPTNNLMVFNNVDPKIYLKQRPIFYFSSPAHVDLIPHYNPMLVVFDYIDEPVEEFASLAPYRRRALTSADLVITSSERLYRDGLTINPNTILVPNACDFDHFARAQNRNLPIPEDIKHLKPPIVGYHGAIATWLNFDLIVRTADSLPHGHVVMIGPYYNIANVPKRPNLHWLGYKAFDRLPNYTQLFDAAMIPFRISRLTEAVNPIKMWEYMATGIPVVTTALPEASNIREIYYSANDEQFIANIRRALAEDPVQFRQARISLARDNNWMARARQILQAMEYTLGSLHHLDFGSTIETKRNRQRRKVVIKRSHFSYKIAHKKTEFRSSKTPLLRSSSTIHVKKPLIISV